MDQYAFAITTCDQHYQLKSSADLHALFAQAKHIFPVRRFFEQHLQKAASLPEGYVRLNDPDPEPGESFEILLGDYQAIKKYVRLQE